MCEIGFYLYFFALSHVTHKAESFKKREECVLKRKVLSKTVRILKSLSKSEWFNKS